MHFLPQHSMEISGLFPTAASLTVGKDHLVPTRQEDELAHIGWNKMVGRNVPAKATNFKPVTKPEA
jgi:hypothetical protein